MRKVLFFAALSAVLCLAVPAGAALIGKIGDGASVNCGTTATVMDDPSISDVKHRWVEICNPADSTGTIYFGGPGVTAATGRPVKSGSCWPSWIRVAGGTKVYCVASAATAARITEFTEEQE